MLRDTPRSYGAYTPENFDRSYVGPLSATEALVRSRNVPAVTLAAKLGQPSLFQLLKTAGVSGLVSEQHHGLGIVLGSAELTMQDLVRLYAALLNRGRLQPLRFVSGQQARERERAQLVSAQAAYLVLQMLGQAARPDEIDLPVANRAPRVAFKTGTSWGFRDAWTVGVAGRYVLAVWVGDFFLAEQSRLRWSPRCGAAVLFDRRCAGRRATSGCAFSHAAAVWTATRRVLQRQRRAAQR